MEFKQRQFVTFAVAISAIAATGCSNDAFTQVNKTITQITGATKKLGSARMPTAAIATALGGVELLKALSKDGQSAKSSGKIIAAGGGNAVGGAGSAGIIAAGGLNFSVLQAATVENKFDGTPIEQDIKDVNKSSNGVTGKIKYSSLLDKDAGLITSEITDFTGVTNGYDIKAKGKFFYQVRPGFGEVKASMTGEVFNEKIKLNLEKLEFQTKDPLPTADEPLGTFVISGEDGKDKIVLTTSINLKGGKVVAEAEVTINGEKRPDKVKFDQDNPNFDGAAAEQ